jgi:N-acetyl-alpha-D-muramate 1-phosphate uridylyltransferase
MVLYGDTYLDIEYAAVLEAFSSSGAVALMTVLRNEDRWDTSNVVFDGAHILRHDKRTHTPDMHYIDYGLGVLKRDVFAQRACNETFDLSDVYGQLATEGKLAGYEVTQRFYEIGTPAGLAATETFLRKRSQTSCNQTMIN